MSESIDFEAAQRLFAYDPDSGAIRWRRSTNPRIAVGSVAGCVDRHGYVRITVAFAGQRRRSIAAHRLAWLLTHGRWPIGEIDHVNGRKADNRIVNLRDVDRRENAANRSGPDRDSSTGLLGASRHKSGKFLSQIRREGKYHYLGLHATPELAHAAYVAASQKLAAPTVEAAA